MATVCIKKHCHLIFTQSPKTADDKPALVAGCQLLQSLPEELLQVGTVVVRWVFLQDQHKVLQVTSPHFLHKCFPHILHQVCVQKHKCKGKKAK